MGIRPKNEIFFFLIVRFFAQNFDESLQQNKSVKLKIRTWRIVQINFKVLWSILPKFYEFLSVSMWHALVSNHIVKLGGRRHK